MLDIAAVCLVIAALLAYLNHRFVGLPTGDGLRGGISVAMALALPAGGARDTVVALTYGLVVFSILVQGLSIGQVTRRAVSGNP